MKKTKRYFIIGLMMLLATLCFAGCGGSKKAEKVSATPNHTPTATVTATPTPTPQPTATATPKPTATPTPALQKFKANVYTSSKNKEIYFYSIENQNYLSEWQLTILGEDDKVTIYTTEVNNFNGFNIQKMNGDPLDGEYISYYTSYGEKCIANYDETLLSKGGYIMLTGITSETQYRLSVFTGDGGTYCAVVQFRK